MNTTQTITYNAALRLALIEEMERDERVFLMGEDIAVGIWGVTRGLIDRFGPERVRNSPIAEAALVGAGVGAAIADARPVVELMFASFAYLAMDQLANQLAKVRYMSAGQLHAPLTIRASLGMGHSIGAQHSDATHAMLAHVPGLKIAIPASPRDARGLLKTAIRDEDPVVVFEPLVLANEREDVPVAEELIPFGTAKTVRAGSDVTVIAIGAGVRIAKKVADRLSVEGISIEVIDPRTIVPFDWGAVFESVTKTRRVVIVDDATLMCSVASEVAASIAEYAFDALVAPVARVTRPNTPVPFSRPLEAFIAIDEGKVEHAVMQVLEYRGAK